MKNDGKGMNFIKSKQSKRKELRNQENIGEKHGELKFWL